MFVKEYMRAIVVIVFIWDDKKREERVTKSYWVCFCFLNHWLPGNSQKLTVKFFKVFVIF